MNIKKIIAAGAALMVFFTATGCSVLEKIGIGGGEGSAESSASSQVAPTQEPQKLEELLFVQPGDKPFVNAALEKELNSQGISLKVNTYPDAQYKNKISLLNASGVNFDLFSVNEKSSIVYFAKNKLAAAINPSEELKKLFSKELWEKASYNGKIYGVPAMYNIPNGFNSLIGVPKDVLSAAGYESFAADDMGELFAVLQRAVTPEGGEAEAFTWFSGAPTWLHRKYLSYPFSVDNFMNLVLIKDNNEVLSYYESKVFKEDANFYNRLYVNGRVKSNVLEEEMPKKGTVLPSQGFNDDNTGARKLDFVAVGDDPLYATEVTQTFTAISKNSKNPQLALKLLAWLYNSQKNYDVFHYGEEGVDYSINQKTKRIEKAEVSKVNVDEKLTGYRPYIRYNKNVSSGYIAAVTDKGSGVAVAKSACFNFDATGMEEICRNLKQVVQEKLNPIKYGVVNYEENINEAIEALNAAGLKEYINAYEEQYKAFLEGKIVPEATEKPTAKPTAKPSGESQGSSADGGNVKETSSEINETE